MINDQLNIFLKANILISSLNKKENFLQTSWFMGSYHEPLRKIIQVFCSLREKKPQDIYFFTDWSSSSISLAMSPSLIMCVQLTFPLYGLLLILLMVSLNVQESLTNA